MTNLPEKVAAAIAAYKEALSGVTESAERVEARTNEIQTELARAKAELDAATDAAIENPTPANTRRETDLRKRVAELTLELSGAEHRKRRAFELGQSKLSELARQAVVTGREEAVQFFEENHADKLKAIADAKYAYLQTLIGYHHFRKQAAAYYYEAVRQTNPSLFSQTDSPYFAEVSFTDRSGPQIYGISPNEVDRAVRQGTIWRGSCEHGKEITEESDQ
ncbi:hypothetical protein [Paenibacillus ehimensis]|uniref:Phage protein n=1 Tax=Paenibacillus ehimensis TaxID=79264 RepID=A0ABT8VMJ6_9BACL|nr:hypothetical protein [Paenibacillus ehimensis]MDO3682208.1 hypothetical protein [Paenibacillus ehimensis]